MDFMRGVGTVFLGWIIAAIIFAICMGAADAAPGDIREIKLGNGATQYQLLQPFPAAGIKCLRYLDGADGNMLNTTVGCWNMGSGFQISGGVINAIGSNDYATLTNVPLTFATTSTLINDSTVTGRALVTAVDAAAARTTLGILPRSYAYVTRALNTCFQPSATRDVDVIYRVDIDAVSTLAAGQRGTVYLEIFTDAACTAGTQEITRGTLGISQGLGLSVTLTSTMGIALPGAIPAGRYVKLRTENNSGTPTFTARPGQEVLQ